MSTTQEATEMSSTAAQTTDVDSESEIHWQSLFDELGNEDYEPVGSSQLALMVSLHADGVADEQEAGEKMLEAVDAGHLEKNENGYHIAGATPPEPDTEPDTKLNTTTENESQDVDEDQESTEDNTDQRLDEAHAHINGRMQEMDDKVDEMYRAFKVQMPMMTTAMRNLFGEDIPFNEMPEAADQLRATLEEHEEVLQEVNDKMASLGELTDSKQESTESRVIQLRRHIVEQAEKGNGKFGMNDKEIRSFFQYEFSRSWASQLLDKVADHEAFTKKTFSDKRPKQVRVDVDKIPEGSIYRLKNSEESREA